jgi:hypothetical protein
MDLITVCIRIFLESLRKIKKIIDHKKSMDKKSYSYVHTVLITITMHYFLVVEEIGYSLNADVYTLNLLDIASEL